MPLVRRLLPAALRHNGRPPPEPRAAPDAGRAARPPQGMPHSNESDSVSKWKERKKESPSEFATCGVPALKLRVRKVRRRQKEGAALHPQVTFIHDLHLKVSQACAKHWALQHKKKRLQNKKVCKTIDLNFVTHQYHLHPHPHPPCHRYRHRRCRCHHFCIRGTCLLVGWTKRSRLIVR